MGHPNNWVALFGVVGLAGYACFAAMGRAEIRAPGAVLAFWKILRRSKLKWFAYRVNRLQGGTGELTTDRGIWTPLLD